MHSRCPAHMFLKSSRQETETETETVLLRYAFAGSHRIHSARRPPVICSPVLLRRSGEPGTSERPAPLKLLSGAFFVRFASDKGQGSSPLAPHRPRSCAPQEASAKPVTPAAAQRGRAQNASCAPYSPVQDRRALRIAHCLVASDCT